MRYNLLFVGMILFLSLSISAQNTKRVLFIGNSYTGANNLPQMVYNAAISVQDTLIYDSHTPGGARFMAHAADAGAMTKISSQKWDFVVLQAQSQEPSWPQSQIQVEVFPHAKTLADTIRYFNKCSEPMFFMTWGRQNGDASNCAFAPWVCTYEGMDSALRASYTHMALVNNSEISPVGPVWRYIRNHYPTINLYSADGSHPSVEGSYAAALCFYTVVFDKDPNLIQWNANLSSQVSDSIKMAVKRVAYDSLSYWNHTVPPAITASYTYIKNGSVVTFTNTVANSDSLVWDFGDGSFSNKSNPAHTYIQSGQYQVSLSAYLCGVKHKITQTIIIDSTSIGITNTTKNLNISTFPNPVKSELSIKLSELNQDVFQLQIVDMLGNVILRKENIAHTKGEYKINVQGLAKGVYFLNIQSGDQTTVKKIIKQ